MKYSGFTGFCRVLAPCDFPVGASDKEATCQCRRHETWVQSPCWEDPLEEGMATHSSILSWRIPMDRGAWWARVHSITTSWTQLKRLSLHTQADLKHLLMKITSVDTQMAYMTCDETCLTGWDTAATWLTAVYYGTYGQLSTSCFPYLFLSINIDYFYSLKGRLNYCHNIVPTL